MSENLKLRYSDDDIESSFSDELVKSVCKTAAFQRLKGISFLGAVEREPSYLKLRNNRFDHSIGVALLAQHYAKAMELSDSERVLVVLSALLHDLGHAPLSHSLEPLFSDFGLDHHIATSNLLQGKVKLGEDLAKLLRKNRIDSERLVSLMSGEDFSALGCIFSYPINVDTIEAIWRGGAYFRKQLLNPVSVLDSFIKKEFENGVIDSFWQEKNNFYKLMIYSREGVAADHWARVRVQSSSRSLQPEDFYLTEKRFFEKYKNENIPDEPALVKVKVRKFIVNNQITVSDYSAIEDRYEIIRSKNELEISPPRSEKVKLHSDALI